MRKSTDDLIHDLSAAEMLGDTPPAAITTQPNAAPAVPRKPRQSSTLLLLGAIVLIAVIGSLPVLSLALYPFSLFVTLTHESWHALLAVVTGGSVHSLEISSDLSGQVTHQGGIEALIAPAGYIGASITGAAVLVAPLRLARWLVGGLALFPLVALVFLHPSSPFTAIWCIAFIAALGMAAWRLNGRFLAFLQIFLGLEIALNALRDLMTLVFISGSDTHMQTDARNMSQALFGPSLLWSVLWTLLSIVVLSAALYRVGTGDLRRLRGR